MRKHFLPQLQVQGPTGRVCLPLSLADITPPSIHYRLTWCLSMALGQGPVAVAVSTWVLPIESLCSVTSDPQQPLVPGGSPGLRPSLGPCLVPPTPFQFSVSLNLPQVGDGACSQISKADIWWTEPWPAFWQTQEPQPLASIGSSLEGAPFWWGWGLGPLFLGSAASSLCSLWVPPGMGEGSKPWAVGPPKSGKQPGPA